MKNILLGLFAVACLAFASACTSINSSDGGNLTIYPKTIGPTDNYRPLYTIDTKRRVSGHANVNVLFGLFAWGDGSGIADNADIYGSSGLAKFLSFMPDAKRRSAQAAFYNACKNAHCDSIVAAKYEITRKNYLIFSKCSVEVKGFPATLSSVEVVKPLPYYIDSDGKIVILDKFVNPVKLFDENRSAFRSRGWFF